MHAVGFSRSLPIDDPESLVDLELPRPEPTGHDLLVRVHAIAVNPVDTKVRRSLNDGESLDEPRVIGWDASGVVEAVGPEVTLFAPGDEVYYAGDLNRPGCNASFQLVDERIVGHKPRSLSHSAAAALPLTAITAYEAFFDRLGIDRDGGSVGETLLIIGGSGGVGSIGIQLAKHAGLRVFATASRKESRDWAVSLGVDAVIDYTEPMRPQIEELGLSHVDHVAIFNDTDGHWDESVDLIRPQGRIVSIVENSGPLAMEGLKRKSASLAWELMFTRAMYATPDMIEQHRLLEWVAQRVDDGTLRTTVSQVLNPMDAATLRRAHAEIEAGHVVGKIVLEGAPGS